jgi:hypothetical protein
VIAAISCIDVSHDRPWASRSKAGRNRFGMTNRDGSSTVTEGTVGRDSARSSAGSREPGLGGA